MNTHSTSIGLSCSSGLTGRARVAITSHARVHSTDEPGVLPA
jgi:hypothetical protein